MALLLRAPSGQGGNMCIVLGGEINAANGAGNPWSNPCAGQSTLEVALTWQPDSPLAGGDELFSNFGGGQAFHGSFRLSKQPGNNLRFQIYDGSVDFNAVRFTTTDAPIVAGQLLRIQAWWTATPFEMGIMVNGTARAGGIEVVGVSPTRTTPQTIPGHGNGAIEIGAMSYLDALPAFGVYAEAAIWNVLKTALDRQRYGTGWAPSLLSPDGRLRYVPLTNYQPLVTGGPTNQESPVLHGSAVCQWTGFEGGVYEHFTGMEVSHPQVFYTPPTAEEEEPAYQEHMHEDRDSLPVDGLEIYERMGFPGKRSGNPPLLVPSGLYPTVQQAYNAAVPGDDIHIALTGVTGGGTLATKTTVDGVTPLMPPRMMRTLTMATAITMVTAITMAPAVTYGGDRSFIRVMSVNAPLLPKRTLRDVYHPDGSVSRYIHESAKIGPPHAAHLANFLATAFTGSIGNGWDTSGAVADGWMFHGLKLNGTQVLIGDSNAQGGAFVRGPYPDRPRRIVLIQCYGDGDQSGVGANAITTFFAAHGERIGAVACYVDRYYQPGGYEGGEAKMFGGHSGGPGPYHYELTTMRVPTTFGLWGGGGVPSRNTGVMGNNITWCRNHEHTPPEWRKANLNPLNGFGRTGWQVTIDAAGRVTQTGGVTWNPAAVDGPQAQCVMSEPATGIARRIAATDYSVADPLILEVPWPGGAVTTPITVYFQWAFPNLRYNSGLEMPATTPTATFTTGSNVVAFSHPLPTTVEARPVGGPSADYRYDGHYIYPNSTSYGGNAASNQPGDNGWGTQWNFSSSEGYSPTFGGAMKPKAQALRGQIMTIAANRLSCTLEFVWPGEPGFTTGGATHTVPYSVVTHDGLWREMPSKSFLETKCGDHHLIEANVIDFAPGTGTLHSMTQPENWTEGGGIGQVVLTGDLATFTGGETWADFPQAFVATRIGLRRLFGDHWAYAVMKFSASAGDNLFNTRILKRIVSPTVAELEPIDPEMDLAQQPTSYTGPYSLFTVSTPWNKIKHQIWRYNLIKSVSALGPDYQSGHSDADGEVAKGGKLLVHDNLALKLGDPSLYGGAAGRSGISHTTRHYHWRPGTGKVTEDNGDRAYRNNTVVHTNSAGTHGVFALSADDFIEGVTSYTISKNIENNNNIVTHLIGGRTMLIRHPSGFPFPVDGVWDVPTVQLQRNIFAGAGVGTMTDPNAATWVNEGTGVYVAQHIARFPDNGFVLDNAHVGFHDLANANLDDVTNYALDHIFTEGTVAVTSAANSSVTLSGATFPSTVVPGQFFRTDDVDAVPMRIIAKPDATHLTLEGNYGLVVAGRTYAVTFKRTGADGRDPGVNIPVLAQMLAGVTSIP